ncbi:MAG: hypothetical protein ACRDDY_05330 [Clostridium sp.]|uniref:hypothetical protein n=1 Tax=Clostridium sp. TaxID=1506 RepID=UPI003EE45530
MDSSNHATILAHLYFLSDAINRPDRIISGDYDLMQVLSDSKDGGKQYQFYLREPRTQFFVSADPSTFAVGNIDMLSTKHPVDIFQRIGKIAAFRLYCTDMKDNWPFNEGVLRTITPMSEIQQITTYEMKRMESNPVNDEMRLLVEKGTPFEPYIGFVKGAVDLAKLISGDAEAKRTIELALKMVKHNTVRKELKKSLAKVL